MNKLHSKIMHLLASLVLVSSTLLFSQQAVATSADQEDNGAAMVGDLLFARPIGLVGTVLGSAAFVVTLPFSLLGGNVVDAGKSLVIVPIKFTFFRPLGGK